MGRGRRSHHRSSIDCEGWQLMSMSINSIQCVLKQLTNIVPLTTPAFTGMTVWALLNLIVRVPEFCPEEFNIPCTI